MVLQNASCQPCQRITQKIEERCLVSMMRYGRARLGLRRKDRATATVRAEVRFADGSIGHRQLEWSQLPALVAVPAFRDHAGILINRPRHVFPPCDGRLLFLGHASKPLPAGVADACADLNVDYAVFAQMLAKIGLGAAVKAFGVDAFEPLVRNFILRDPDEYGDWVGGIASPPSTAAADKTILHRVDVRSEVRSTHAGGDVFVAVLVQLFANYGGPVNYVVVGRRR
jgi:hypothetical protein